MNRFLKSAGIAAAMAATTLGFTQGAEARDRWHRGGGDDAAIAVGAGILGLAVGAAIADSHDDRYYDNRYYGSRRYVTVRDYPGYYYYYEGSPRRYYRDRYYGRPDYRRPYYRGDGYGYGNRWDRGWDRGYGYGYHRDRGYDRGWGRHRGY